jgi:hypothetical protein
MGFYEADRKHRIAPEEAVLVVHDFLTRCKRWAEREVPRRLEQAAADGRPESAAKLHAWVSYVQFTDHTLNELEAGTLDHWFDPTAEETAE